jgi:hypothetical protein
MPPPIVRTQLTELPIITAYKAKEPATCQNCFFRTPANFCRLNPPTVMRSGAVYSDNAELPRIKNPMVDFCGQWYPKIETDRNKKT